MGGGENDRNEDGFWAPGGQFITGKQGSHRETVSLLAYRRQLCQETSGMGGGDPGEEKEEPFNMADTTVAAVTLCFDKDTTSRRWHPGLCLGQYFSGRGQEDNLGKWSRVRRDGVSRAMLPGPVERRQVS